MARDCITNSWYRQNRGRVAGIALDFLAQMADMGLDQAGISVVAKAPNMLHDLIRGTNSVGIYYQEVEQLALRGRQAHCFAIDSDLIMQRIDVKRPNCYHRRWPQPQR